MQTLVIQGINKGDCHHKMVQEYGPNAIVLREKEIHTSFFGLFPRKRWEIEFYLSPQRNISLQNGEPVLPARQFPVKTNSASRSDTTLDFAEAKKRVLEAAGKDPDQILRQVQEQEEKDTSQQQILEQLKMLTEKIESAGSSKPQEDHSALVRIAQMLRQNEFSQTYITNLLDRARKELALDTLEDFNAVQDIFLEWIGESIKIFHVQDNPEMVARIGGLDGVNHQRIVVLVGPTGVGKTTTVAKLAAIYGIGNSGRRPLSVRIITIDAFRIGAVDQIMKFGDIMEIPVSYIDNRRDLRKEIDLYREEADLILIDTIGRSPRDSSKLGEMKEMLEACGPKAEIHLVFSASTKTGDIAHILRQFEPFGYKAVVLTKFDETRQIGNVISALAERNKPVSYVTDGQDVPKYIKKASVLWFLTNLEEFRIDREKMEKLFPLGEADQFQWS